MKDSLGSVDAFGLDEFGSPVGLNPLWGAVAGTGISTLGSMGVRQFATPGGKWWKYSEAIGFGLGALTGGGLLFWEGTRSAGWTALASAFLNSGLRQLEAMVLAPDPAAMMKQMMDQAAAAGVAGAVIEPTTVLAGQVGIPQIEPTQVISGNFAEANVDMPQLVGAGLEQANDHIQLVGGPALSQFAGAWGSTHFNKA